MVSPRYSCASRPTADALIRSGRSLLTSVTRSPSLARLRATARIRVSLSPSRKPDGQRVGVGVVELDADGAALVTDRHRLVEPAVGDPQLVEHPQGRAGEVAQLRVVPLALELGDDHDGEHHLVLVEASERPRVGQQHAGVEDVRASLPDDESAWEDALLDDGRRRHGHPSQTGTRTPRPVLNAVADGPGGSPRGRSARPPLRPTGTLSCRRSVVDRALARFGPPDTASFPTRRCLRKYAAGAAVRCDTPDHEVKSG